jgi:hypothetical protein
MESGTIRCAGYVVRKGDRRSAHRVLVMRPEERRPVGKRRLKIILK